MRWIGVFSMLSGSAALLAAALWLWAASTRFPEFSANAETLIENLKLRSEALQRQSRRNATAASAAGISALFQVIGLISSWLG